MARNFPSWVEQFTDIPFRVGGRTREGCDCWGLVNLVWAEHYGHDLPHYSGDYWRAGTDMRPIAESAAAHAKNFERVQPGEEREGDGVLLRVLGLPTHIGLVVCPGWMLHVQQGSDSVLEEYASPRWRVMGFYRYTVKND